MIPKKIHFCWLSGEEYPPLIQYCINTWMRVLPDYEIVLWDTKRFDINSVAWVKEAFEAKKYAFAADYIRFYALYTEGGIYLDSDVEVLKTFTPLLDCKSFIGFEASTEMVEAAIVGSEPGMEWCKEILDFYINRHFSSEMDVSNMLAPIITGNVIRSIYSDFPVTPPNAPISLNKGEFMVYPAHFFSPIKYNIEKNYSKTKVSSSKYCINPNTYCIHRFNASWTVKPALKFQLREILRKKTITIIGKRRTERLITLVRKYHIIK